MWQLQEWLSLKTTVCSFNKFVSNSIVLMFGKLVKVKLLVNVKDS